MAVAALKFDTCNGHKYSEFLLYIVLGEFFFSLLKKVVIINKEPQVEAITVQ